MKKQAAKVAKIVKLGGAKVGGISMVKPDIYASSFLEFTGKAIK